AGPDVLLRGRRHPPAALAGEHERDRGLRHAGAPRHVDARHAGVGSGGDGDMQPRPRAPWGRSSARATRVRRVTRLTDRPVIRSMLIRMTDLATTFASLAAAGALAV